MAEETGGTGLGHRSVSMERVSKGVFEVTNVRGGTMRIGGGDNADFTPVELLLTAIAGCSAVDVDFITVKRAEPLSFNVTAAGEKLRDEDGNHLGDITVRFSVAFPEGEAGDKAREMLPKAIAMSHDRLCTVSRTVVLGTPIDSGVAAD
ncbi:OsmC family protein [Pedococcus bigeumensis]|uniref:OsmC family peroxiredoxin n=1 Tax=Pedococcus bigeumensis TaxID=433644 RepID=A0A502CZY3_9MICO|nr:OsmC family protein [Pedococcus bigeumensis]TPG18403.1 OsmC family peroxiredoxin [Pedococcus bigeumensis]